MDWEKRKQNYKEQTIVLYTKPTSTRATKAAAVIAIPSPIFKIGRPH